MSVTRPSPGRRAAAFLAAAVMLAVAGCPGPTKPPDVFAAPGDILPTATAAQRATFKAGLAVATRRFGPKEGLGPDYNVTFCVACHEKPVFGGASPRYRNFNLVEDAYGTPLGHSGVQSLYDVDTGYVPLAHGATVIATRNGTPFFGVGLLATVTAETIHSHADPNDTDHDGLRGRVNLVNGFVGRFGRKAQTASLEGFVRGPLFDHLGITTNPLSQKPRASSPSPATPPARTAAACPSGASSGSSRTGSASSSRARRRPPSSPSPTTTASPTRR